MVKQTDPATLDLTEFLPYQLSVLEQQISRTIAEKYSKEHGLSRMQWRIVSSLAMLDGITAKEICYFTHMEKMQASRAISGLVRQGLLNQAPSPDDLRANVLSLTSRGKKMYQQILPKVLNEERRIFSILDKNELDNLRQLIHKLSLSFAAHHQA